MKTPAEEVGAGQGRLERRTDGPRTDADESVDGQITGVDLMVRSGFREYEVKNCVLLPAAGRKTQFFPECSINTPVYD